MNKPDNPFVKITVEGKINVGKTYDIQQAPVKADDHVHFYDTAAGQDSDNFGQWDDSNSDGTILKWGFSDEPTGDLTISGSGMVTSFGIFGAPGSGKTVLLLHLLKQILSHEPNSPAKRYGALILDPKASLIEDITAMVREAGREKDLVIINRGILNDKKNNSIKKKVNVIDCFLEPYELGSILVLAARSAGVAASDAFWFLEWSNLFASSLSLLQIWNKSFDKDSSTSPGVPPKGVTLKQLLDALFNQDDQGEREIQTKARIIKKDINESYLASVRNDILVDIKQIERFYKQHYVGTIEAFITKAFGMFRREKYKCFSNNEERTKGEIPFYEDIIENGRIVLVSISPSEPVLAKTLCTLIKCLFQRTVLGRGDLLYTGKIKNDQRPLLIACDEYSEIASEIAGESMGDGQFLALARQYGCMALLATQSVNVLEASSLKETWRSVFSNFAAKFYMRLVDNQTAEEASKLAGESDWKYSSTGMSSGKDSSYSRNENLLTRKNLPSTILTHVLKTGEAVVIGSLDGGKSTPGTFYLKIPFEVTLKVEDEKGKCIPHASVQVKGTTSKTTTDANGLLKLQLYKPGRKLIISSSGYISKEAEIPLSKIVSIVLMSEKSAPRIRT